MGTRFLVETRFRGEETVASQLLKYKLVSLGYRFRPVMKLESGETENRFQRFERRANEDEDVTTESDRLKAAGVWAGIRTVRFL